MKIVNYSCAFLTMVFVSTNSVTAHEMLPIGDGNISSSPKVGYAYSCQTNFMGGQGAGKLGNWSHGKYWDLSEKPTVEGSVEWPDSQVSISLEGNERIISANNLPKHTTGIYPIQRSDPAYAYDGNPNSIGSQNILLKLPADPKVAASASCVPMGMIGFTTSGTALYNSLDGQGRDAAYHEIQDKCNGHPERSSQYHYHSYSSCMVDPEGDKGGHSSLVGYALDGFGIYGLKGEKGKILKNEDLDACHGHTHTIMWNGKMQKIYHYHFTKEYPYSIGCFKGTPASTGMRQNQGMQGRGMQNGGMPAMQNSGMQGGQGSNPHHQVLEIAAKTLGVSVNDLMEAVGPPPPDFEGASKKLGISVDKIRSAMMGARQSVEGGR